MVLGPQDLRKDSDEDKKAIEALCKAIDVKLMAMTVSPSKVLRFEVDVDVLRVVAPGRWDHVLNKAEGLYEAAGWVSVEVALRQCQRDGDSIKVNLAAPPRQDADPASYYDR